jgi:hypothetical protein
MDLIPDGFRSRHVFIRWQQAILDTHGHHSTTFHQFPSKIWVDSSLEGKKQPQMRQLAVGDAPMVWGVDRQACIKYRLSLLLRAHTIKPRSRCGAVDTKCM